MGDHDGEGPSERATDGGLKAYFLQERPMLLRLLTARLRSAEEAEDVLQEVWLRLSDMTSAPIAQPGGYLFRIANNIATDRRRSALSRRQREQDWMDVHGDAGATPSAETRLLAAERLRQVDATIASLPDRTARIFRLYRYEAMPRRSIAELIGISVSAVEKHLQAAYRLLHGLSMQDDIGTAKGQGR